MMQVESHVGWWLSGVQHAASSRQPWRFPLAAGLNLLLAMVAIVFVARRFSGALLNPLSPWALFGAMALAIGLAAAVRTIDTSTLPGKLIRPPKTVDAKIASLGQWSWAILPTVSLAGIAVSICLPGASLGGMVLVWGAFVAEEFWAWWPLPAGVSTAESSSTPAGTDSTQAEERPANEGDTTRSGAPVEATGQITRQMIRREVDGSERFEGWLKTEFSAGQRTANEHLVFCPPFGATPRVEFRQSAGPQARVKLGQVLPYGARFDVKLAESHEQTVAVVIEFSAVLAPPEA